MKGIVSVAIFLVPAFAMADVSSIRAQEKSCLDKARTNMAMEECEGDAWQAADQELNALYQKFVARLKDAAAKEQGVIPASEGSAEVLKRLVASERAWITYRDANCSFEATEMLGGSGEGLSYSGCEVRTTLDRITELNNVLNAGH